MKRIFINLSNHPSKDWSIEQKCATRGELHDWKFPNIDPTLTSERVKGIAKECVRDIQGSYKDATEIVVHVMGEMVFTHNFVMEATKVGIKCVASTTERISIDNGDGTKTTKFAFVQFREY